MYRRLSDPTFNEHVSTIWFPTRGVEDINIEEEDLRIRVRSLNLVILGLAIGWELDVIDAFGVARRSFIGGFVDAVGGPR